MFHDIAPGPYADVRFRPGMRCYTRVAQGNIYPNVFVTIDGCADWRCRQAVPGDRLYGISQGELREQPYNWLIQSVDTRAAADGENCFIYGFPADGVEIILGGTVHPGNRLTTDIDGHAIIAALATDWIGAVAMEHGFVGQIKHVQLIMSQRRKG